MFKSHMTADAIIRANCNKIENPGDEECISIKFGLLVDILRFMLTIMMKHCGMVEVIRVVRSLRGMFNRDDGGLYESKCWVDSVGHTETEPEKSFMESVRTQRDDALVRIEELTQANDNLKTQIRDKDNYIEQLKDEHDEEYSTLSKKLTALKMYIGIPL